MCLLVEEVPAEISHSDSSLSLDFGQPRLPFYLTLLGVAQWIRPVVIQPQPTQCSWASNGGIVSPWSPPAQVKLYLCIYWHEWLFPIKITGMWMLMWLFLHSEENFWQKWPHVDRGKLPYFPANRKPDPYELFLIIQTIGLHLVVLHRSH